MQIIKAVVTPVELPLRKPVRMVGVTEITSITAIFVRLDTREGQSAWGCTVAHEQLTGEDPQDVLRVCQQCADMATDLHPTDIEYSLNQLAPIVEHYPAARCAFDLAFHDLLGLAASMPLYRLLGGYRSKMQTSATIPISSVAESVELANERMKAGFRMLKIKGGMDPDQDVQRVKSIRRSLPDLILRLDADGAYSIRQALDVARALSRDIEMLEQPTAWDDIESLRQVTTQSRVPILADQSATEPASALAVAAGQAADGLSVKMASCGGLRCARQIDAIARAARIATVVSCLIEPALLIAAGLSFALSSPNVQYGDLDGHLDLLSDPTIAGFRLEEGWLVATDTPGLGCTLDL